MEEEKSDGEVTFKRITNNDIYEILMDVRDEVKKTNGRVTNIEENITKTYKDEVLYRDRVRRKFLIIKSTIYGLSGAFILALAWLIKEGGLFR